MISATTKETARLHGTSLDALVVALRARKLDALLTSGFATLPEDKLLAAFRLAGDPEYRPGGGDGRDAPTCRCGNPVGAVDAHGGRHVTGSACRACTTNSFEGL